MAASIKNRNRSNVKQNKIDSTKTQSMTDEEVHMPYQPWTPSAYTAFKALVSARLCAAIWANIADCDETYNYWEPLHYMLHGSGLQTWEYSPAYALRSYTYLKLHMLPLRFYITLFQLNKLLQFYLLRVLLCIICSVCEVYFYRGICKHFGANTGRLTLGLLLFNTGMFISSAALLPSSFTMYTSMVAMAAWILGHTPVAILAIAIGTLVGWPFAAAMGIPIAFDLLFRKRAVFYFFKWSLLSLVVCLIPILWIDSLYYGKFTLAPLNIVLYNVFSEHGSEIYGVDPWHFYFVNGFLNFNLAFMLALVSLPFVVVVNIMLEQPPRGKPTWLLLSPMYIWIIIFFTQPHKEERFLFPIYPLLCLAASLTMDYIQKCYSLVVGVRSRHLYYHYSEQTSWIPLVFGIIYAVISISRIMALYYGYHAPLEVYADLTRVSQDARIHNLAADKHVNVCVGKEWFRFPSSFFLPDERWHLQFIKSHFRGQLPKHYEKGDDATRIVPEHMNDMNLEETTRYINITRCHYLVDFDVPEDTEHEPGYSANTQEWKVVISAKFLYAPQSHPFFRAFYIPYFSDLHTTYRDYNILKTSRTKRHSKH